MKTSLIGKRRTDVWHWPRGNMLNHKPHEDDGGRLWKFCKKCHCKVMNKTGLFNLSHYTHEHNGDFKKKKKKPSANLSSVTNDIEESPTDVPTGPPVATTLEPTTDED